MEMELKDLLMSVHSYRYAESYNDGILLISDLNGKPDLYYMSGDNLINLTENLGRVGGYRKEEDLNIVLLMHDIGGNERWIITGFRLFRDGDRKELFRIGDGESINIPSKIDKENNIFAYASNRRETALFDIFIYHIDDNEERMIFGGSPNTYPVSFSPKGDKLILLKSIGTWEQYLYIVDPMDGGLIDSLVYEDTHISNVEWIDNETIYFITDYNSDYRYIASYSIGGGIEEIVSMDMEIELFKVFDGRLIYTINDSGDSRLYIDEEEVKKPKGVVTHIDVVDKVIISMNTVKYGESIWILDGGNGELKPLKYCRLLDGITESLVEPTVERSRMSDGLYIESLIYRDEKPVATIVMPHGGPESQSRPIFNPLIQILVSEGYQIVQPNYRGSSGYGKIFRHLDDRRRRKRSLLDIVEVVRDLRERGIINDDRIGIMGGSYGGFATLYLITHFPDMWRAAVSVVGISNLETFLKNTGPWRRKLREREYGSLEEDLDFLREISPIYYIENIKCPLLLIHGRNDSRVPVEESIEIYERLKDLGREAEIHIFEDEGHGVAKLSNRKVYIEKVLNWFARYLR